MYFSNLLATIHLGFAFINRFPKLIEAAASAGPGPTNKNKLCYEDTHGGFLRLREWGVDARVGAFVWVSERIRSMCDQLTKGGCGSISCCVVNPVRSSARRHPLRHDRVSRVEEGR